MRTKRKRSKAIAYRTPAPPIAPRSSVRTIRASPGRKLKRPEEAARNIIPPVSSTIKTRSATAKENITPNKFKGRHERTALRRLVKRKYELITVDNIDKRSDAYRKYRRIVSGITSDLGGEDRITTMEHSLIQAYASAFVRMNDLTARQLLGDEYVEFNDLASAISSMVRVAHRLGIQRRPREVTPLSSYLNGQPDTIEGEMIENE